MNNRNKTLSVINNNDIKNKIYTIRGIQVMLDRDLAELYEVKTKVFNQAVKRNLERFPETYMFQLTDKEKQELVTNCDQLNTLKHSSTNPYVFTEYGVVNLPSVLKSKKAIQINIQIVNSFVEMRRFLISNAQVFQRLDRIEYKQLDTDKKFDKIFEALEQNEIKPKQKVFFDGQIFDAYKFVSDIIRKANNSIVIIDNYIDDTVLDLLTKRNKNVKAIILTKEISSQLRLDIAKHNSQYPEIQIKEFKNAHDRFIILDNKDVYVVGASLKDLGKKWFAFSKIEVDSFKLIEKIKEL